MAGAQPGRGAQPAFASDAGEIVERGTATAVEELIYLGAGKAVSKTGKLLETTSPTKRRIRTGGGYVEVSDNVADGAPLSGGFGRRTKIIAESSAEAKTSRRALVGSSQAGRSPTVQVKKSYRPGDVLPDGRVAGQGPGAAHISDPGFSLGLESSFSVGPKRGTGVNLLNNRTIQPRPASIRFGPARGGGGNELAQRYARQVTGGAEWSVYVRDVEFEGIRAGTLLDAKYARSSGSFYDISGTDRFTRDYKIPVLLGQARRQVKAVHGLGLQGIEWHFADDAVAGSVRRLFLQNRIPINVRYTPLVGAP
jgi:hypothetical protein